MNGQGFNTVAEYQEQYPYFFTMDQGTSGRLKYYQKRWRNGYKNGGAVHVGSTLCLHRDLLKVEGQKEHIECVLQSYVNNEYCVHAGALLVSTPKYRWIKGKLELTKTRWAIFRPGDNGLLDSHGSYCSKFAAKRAATKSL